jgi:hypothetical protein
MALRQDNELSNVSQSSTEASLAALLRAEAAQTGSVSANGGTGAGGRFTAVEELKAVLRTKEILCGWRLQDYLNEKVAHSSTEQASHANNILSLDFLANCFDLQSALDECGQQSRLMLSILLCLDEHYGHLEQSLNLWKQLLSPGSITEATRKNAFYWIAGVRTASQCSQLHRLLAVHALPAVLIFVRKDERISLLETFAYTSKTNQSTFQRIEEICETFGPLLRKNSRTTAFEIADAGR